MILNDNFIENYILYSMNLLKIISVRDKDCVDEDDYKIIANILFENDSNKNIYINNVYISDFLRNSLFVNNILWIEKYFYQRIKLDVFQLEKLFENIHIEDAMVLLNTFQEIDGQFIIDNIDAINKIINKLYSNQILYDLECYASESIPDCISSLEREVNGHIIPPSENEVEENLIEITYDYYLEMKNIENPLFKMNIDKNNVIEIVNALDLNKEIENHYAEEEIYDESDNELLDVNYIDKLFSY